MSFLQQARAEGIRRDPEQQIGVAAERARSSIISVSARSAASALGRAGAFAQLPSLLPFLAASSHPPPLPERARSAPAPLHSEHDIMCGPDHAAPGESYATHEGIKAALADDNFVSAEFPVAFKTATGESYTYKSFICYKKDAPPRPLVMVLPNYAGMKQFDKDQAMFLAKLGYVGLAVDVTAETEGYMYADRNPVVECKDGETAELKSRFSRTVQSVAGDYVNMLDAKVWE
jgi:hypothetical protein